MTGDKHESATDYRGAGHYPLEITRYYSSSKFDVTGHFGHGWNSIDTATIYSNTYNGNDQYTVRRADGTDIRYRWGSGAGDTTPHKANTKEVLTLFNYQGAQLWEFKLTDGSVELYHMDLSDFSANGNFTSQLMWRENPQGLKQSFTYDAQGRVETITDSNNRQLTYTYYNDGSNHIKSITAPGNRAFKYEYDALGNLEYVIYPDETTSNDDDNPRIQYHYEDDHLDVNDRDNDGDVTERLYPHHLTGITDERGNRYASFTYDGRGRGITTQHAGGADRMDIISFNPITIRNALGKETTYKFSAIGSDEGTMTRLTEVEGHPSSNCLGYNSSITYDANGQKDLVTDFEGNVTDYDIDAEGFESQRIEASNHSEPVRRTVTSTWVRSLFRPDTVTVEGHKITDYDYTNRRVDLITETDLLAAGNPTREWDYNYTYHDTAQLNVESITVDGPRTDVTDATVKTYSTEGLLTESVDALGNSVQFQNHNPEGLPQTMIDSNNVVTELRYTTRGWLDTVTVKSAMGDAVTDYNYYPNGLVQTISQPNGVQLSYQYDDAKRLTRITNNFNEYIEYTLNALGNREEEKIFTGSGSLVRQHNFAFDELGRLLKKFGVNDQELESFTYDGKGNITHITDNNMVEIVQGFDGLDRLEQVADREGGVTVYTYDDLDQLDTVTDANGNVTDYDYNGFGFLTRLSSPDTGVTNYTSYDLAGNLLSKTDARGVVTNYTYDALNRVKTTTYPSDTSRNITYYYDESQTKGFANAGVGRLTRIAEANGTETAWIYNDLGQIVRDIRTVGGQTYTVRYLYDLAGILTHIFYPSGREVEFIQNPNGQTQTVRTRQTASASWSIVADNIAYKPFGPVSEYVYGNGLTVTRAYDLHYRPDLILTSDESTAYVHALDYGFNNNNELDEILDLVEPINDKTFGYDGNMRLTTAQGPYGSMSYDYDAVSNRTLRTTDTSPQIENYVETYTTSPVSNRLQSIDSTGTGGQTASFAYNEMGNITNDGQFVYEYDARGRLAKVSQGANTIATYSYNALGQRVSKAADGIAQHFHFDLQGQLLAESNAQGEPQRDYLYLNGQMVAMVDSGDAATGPDTVEVVRAMYYPDTGAVWVRATSDLQPLSSAVLTVTATTGGVDQELGTLNWSIAQNAYQKNFPDVGASPDCIKVTSSGGGSAFLPIDGTGSCDSGGGTGTPDTVEVTRAIYYPDDSAVWIRATSDLEPLSSAVLTVIATTGGVDQELGTLIWNSAQNAYQKNFLNISTAPDCITVTSSGGGSAYLPIDGTGSCDSGGGTGTPDTVEVTRAIYYPDDSAVWVRATSDLEPLSSAVLTAIATTGGVDQELGILNWNSAQSAYQKNFPNITTAPDCITVTSSSGGSAFLPIDGTGSCDSGGGSTGDNLVVEKAIYYTADQKLWIRVSSDAEPQGSALIEAATVQGTTQTTLGQVGWKANVSYYQQTFTNITSAPDSVVITSTAGDTVTQPVEIQ
ncbi:DUF6531 domain-containing protein [Ketobacter sp.]